MALVAVATQYPGDYNTWMNQIDPVGTNIWCKEVFTSFIEPEIVLAYTTLFEQDAEYLAEYDGTYEMRFFYGLIGALAPNSNMLQANFGRKTSKDKTSNKQARGQQLQEAMMYDGKVQVKKTGAKRTKYSIMSNIAFTSVSNLKLFNCISLNMIVKLYGIL
jgi:hypothetical protein